MVTLRAPRGFALTSLPAGATVRTRLGSSGIYDVIVVFVNNRDELEVQLAACRPHLRDNGGLWIAWPKKSSGIATDLVEQTIRDVALPTGLVDNKVCAIDDTWSGLRLVIRLENRAPKPAPEPKRAARAPARTRRRASPR
ncbi:MAG TPA: DUF3052 family protein [Kofleriaceae bacterium]|nr:DUF3052 family protein [Kofleriaceae bacterium]